MAKKALDPMAEMERLKAENEALQEKLAQAQLAASSAGGYAPGLHVLPIRDKKYEKYRLLRVLPNNSRVEYQISPSGWLHCLMDFLPRKNKSGKVSMRPGIGGYGRRWAHYAKYFKSADFLADLAQCEANGASMDPPGRDGSDDE